MRESRMLLMLGVIGIMALLNSALSCPGASGGDSEHPPSPPGPTFKGEFAAAVDYKPKDRKDFTAIASADFKKTGKSDLVITSSATPGTSIYFNSGDGTFATENADKKHDFDTGNSSSVVAADLNGDGSPDFAVANLENQIIIFSGVDGAFTSFKEILIPENPLVFGAVSMTSSNYVDLLVGIGGHAGILFNDGMGDFSKSSYAVAVEPPQTGISGGIIDLEGHKGIIVASRAASTVTVVIFKDASTVISNTTYPIDGRPGSLTAADFDKKNGLDFAVISTNKNHIEIFLNNGDGTFAKDSPTKIVNVGKRPSSVIAGPLTGTNHIDLAVANYDDKTISILQNDGAGIFTQKSPPLTLNGAPLVITTGDFNGDGHPDLATINFDNSFSVLIAQ